MTRAESLRCFRRPHTQFGSVSLLLGLCLFARIAPAQEEEPEKKETSEEPVEGPVEEQADSTTDTEEDAAHAADEKEEKEESPPVIVPQSFKPEDGASPGSEMSIKDLGEQSEAHVRRVRIEEAKEEALAAAAAAEAAEPEDVDVDPRAGYIPGYKTGTQIGMTPLAPRVPALPGGVTIPFHAPAADDEWEFKFSGYASASLRVSSNTRDNPTPDQNKITLHTDPRIPDFYGAFGGTNATPGSWVDLHFSYGNRTVTSHVNVTTWKPGRAAAYTDVRSQQWVNQAYLYFNLPVSAEVAFDWTVGSFRNQYGGLGQYSAGQYNTAIIGQAMGVGENLHMEYSPSPTYSIHLEHAFMGQLGKPPKDSGPTPFDNAQHPSIPASWIHHAHLGLETKGSVPLVFGLHYMTNWSQDERDQVDNPATYFIDERFRPDGRLNVFGFDARMINNHLGNAAIAVVYADARDAALLKGLGVFGAVDGEQFTRRFLGPIGGGNGKMWAIGGEYNFSVAKFLHHPTPYWGEGPDLVLSAFSNAAFIQSEDPYRDGVTMFKAGGEVTYRFFDWVGISGRYDHVMPNSKDKEETFDVISPKLHFKSSWITHELVTLSYTRWFYGDRTHAEFPFELPRGELDEQMFALHFGMWW